MLLSRDPTLAEHITMARLENSIAISIVTPDKVGFSLTHKLKKATNNLQMIFTTASTPFRVTPTPLFKTKGDLNGYPGTISDSKTFAIRTDNSDRWNIFRGSFARFVAATVTKEEAEGLPMTAYKKPGPTILQYPAIGLAFEKPTEAILSELARIGFVEDSHGKTRYFRGRLHPGQEIQIARLNPKTHCFVPAGIADFSGLKAFAIAQRLISFGLRSFPSAGANPPILTYSEFSDGSSSLKGVNKIRAPGSGYGGEMSKGMTRIKGMIIGFPGADAIPKFRRVQDLPDFETGVYLPYFQGMLIQDKTTIPDIITSTFSLLLGDNPAEIAQAATDVSTGWGSAASTPQGLALSHIGFCMKLALEAGAKPILFMKDDDNYQGTVICGTDFVISSKGKIHTPITHDEIVAELKKFDSHDTAINKLAEIINTIPLDIAGDAKTYLSVTPELLTTPRLIHNLLRQLNVNSSHQQEIRRCLDDCQFSQTFWEAKDANLLIRAYTLIAQDKFLDDDAPIPYNSDVMFTKECDYSVLAAFGSTAPTLYDPTGNPSPILKAPKKETKGSSHLLTARMNDKGKPLIPNGQFPVFLRPLKEALQGFRTMRQSATIAFRVTERRTVASIAYVATSQVSERMSVMLATHYARSKKTGSSGEKRKRGVDDLSPKEIEELAARTKKIKLAGNTSVAFWGDFEVEGGSAVKTHPPDHDLSDEDEDMGTEVQE